MMSFGQTMKKLRRDRDLTQEQLAEILSISPQAISRWETDMAMPDISMIAPLCNLFNITSDELLGIDLTRRQENVSAICDKAEKYYQKGYLEEARTILEDGLHKYPDNIDIIYTLMYLSFWQHNKNDQKDGKYIDEAIRCGEKVLERSTEDHQRHGAIQILCYCYRDVGRIDEAIKLAKSMPLMSESQESLFSILYSGSKAYDAKQREAYTLLDKLSNSLLFLQTELDSGEWAYTQEECAVLREKRIALLNLFFENGDFGFYHTRLCDTYRKQAFYYAQKEEYEKALKHLQLAAEHAIKFITSVSEKRTSLVFRGIERDTFTTSSSDNEAASLLKRMEHSVFDRIRETDDFIKIKERLSEYAGKWEIS